MKTSIEKEPFTFLRSNFTKGAFVLAFFGFFMITYAVTFPPNPQNLQGVVRTFVGVTTAPGDGDDPGSYEGANGLCSAEYSGASLCDQKDILHSITAGNPTAFDIISGAFWINAGVSSGPNTIANDCEGWQTEGAGNIFGVVYNNDENQLQIQDCRTDLSYACCR